MPPFAHINGKDLEMFYNDHIPKHFHVVDKSGNTITMIGFENGELEWIDGRPNNKELSASIRKSLRKFVKNNKDKLDKNGI